MNAQYRILAIDDQSAGLTLLEKILTPEFEFRTATTADEGILAAADFKPHIILLDLIMPGLDGCIACRVLSEMPELNDAKIIVISARPDVETRLAAYEAGAVDYITKPFHCGEVQTKIRTWLKMAHRRRVNQIWCDLEEARDGIGRTLTSLVELRDTETGEHLFRMRWFSQVLAEQLAKESPYAPLIDDGFLKRLFRAAPLHDIGKIGIEDSILRKPGWLTPEEYKAIKRHTIIGGEILENAARNLPYADYLSMAIGIARHHHERFDGSGYPDGLAGAEIPLAARVVSVADVFDAVTSDRVYRKALSMQQSVSIIENGAGTLFDPVVVEAFRQRLPEIKQARRRFQLIDRAPPPKQKVQGDLYAANHSPSPVVRPEYESLEH